MTTELDVTRNDLAAQDGQDVLQELVKQRDTLEKEVVKATNVDVT